MLPDQTRDDLPEEIEEAAQDLEQGHPQDSAPVDPFDPVALREDAADGVTTTDRLYHLPIRKASATHSFIRVHPDSEYRTNLYLLEHKGDDERTTLYLVAPGLKHLREEFPREIKLYRLFLAVTKQGGPFLWPQKLPTDDGMGVSWHESGIAAAEEAMHDWVKVEGDKRISSYTTKRPRMNYGDPVWPEITLRDALALAFKDRLIDSPEHDVLRELRGDL
jgi:hypothetical protein